MKLFVCFLNTSYLRVIDEGKKKSAPANKSQHMSRPTLPININEITIWPKISQLSILCYVAKWIQSKLTLRAEAGLYD